MRPSSSARSITWLGGLKGILERAFYAPAHVDAQALEFLVGTGQFRNRQTDGFQEGRYHKTIDMLGLFSAAGLEVEKTRSIRGIAFGLEERILQLKQSDLEYFDAVLRVVMETASIPSFRLLLGCVRGDLAALQSEQLDSDQISLSRDQKHRAPRRRGLTCCLPLRAYFSWCPNSPATNQRRNRKKKSIGGISAIVPAAVRPPH